MTMIIIAGGIDLSVGSIIAFCSVVGAYLLTKVGGGGYSWHAMRAAWGQVAADPSCGPAWGQVLKLACTSPLAAVCAAVLAGALCGLLTAVIITKAKVVPFIVTLGTMLIVRGAAKGLAGSAPVNIDNDWINSFVLSLAPQDRWKLLPAGGWMMILLAVLFWALLRYTRLGRHTYAIGSNEQTARLCGVAVERVKLWIYSLSGACAGLSGVMLLSRQRQGDPTGAMGYELDVIAAVVIGGGSLSGGEGSIFGTIIGALIMTVIRTGCNLQGLQPWVTQVVTGAIIVIAVALDRLRHRRAA
jgi:ribose/xylose/arabinose/galactoside ABC-type transport system permease subunit